MTTCNPLNDMSKYIFVQKVLPTLTLDETALTLTLLVLLVMSDVNVGELCIS